MKKNSKKGILILVLLLAIGFAAVTTTLVINGTITIGSNQKDFNDKLIFTTPHSITYKDIPSLETNISTKDAGKTLEFSIEVLKTIGDKATVNYTIKNDSQYIADLKGIECKFFASKSEDGSLNGNGNASNDYIKLTPSDIKGDLVPGSTTPGTIDVEMIRSYIGTETSTSEDDEELPIYVQCTINADAKPYSRTTSAEASTSGPQS